MVFPTLVAALALGAPACGEIDPALGDEVTTTEGAIVFGTHDYTFFQVARTYAQAGTICRNTGAHLATLTTAAENSFVAGQVAQHGGGNWWFGYSDAISEGTWQWETGEPIGHVNWAGNAPGGGWFNKDCAAINGGTALWSDLQCGSALMFVCERDAGPWPGQLLTFDYTGNNTSNATRNVSQFAINILNHGTFSFGTCGIQGASFTGDTVLRLYSPNGAQVAFNDDGCVTLGSNISYSASSTGGGQYTIRAGCYDETACTGHIVWRREEQPPPAPPH